MKAGTAFSWSFCLTAALGSGLPLQAVDTTAPSIVGVGSLNGEGVGVGYSEPVNPATATNAAQYRVINAGPPDWIRHTATVTRVTLRPDGQSVQLGLDQRLTKAYVQVWATNVQDLAGNVITNRFFPGGFGYNGGDLRHFFVADLPQPGVNPVETGQVFTWLTIAGQYEVTAGGTGLETNSDGFHFLFSEVTGDFDLLVNVARLDPVNRWSKAGLMVRESLEPGSRNLNVMVTPPDVPAWDGSGNGANCYIATWRETADGPMAEWLGGSRIGGISYPEVWIGLWRRGQTFTALWGQDSLELRTLAITTTTNPFPSTVFVGLATTSANNSAGFATVAEYKAFGPFSATTPLPPRLYIARTERALGAWWFGLPGFEVESAPWLGSGALWAPVTNQVMQINGTNWIWLDPAGAAREFFRLRR